jgi:tellurite resistance protein TehA-like permease
MGWPARAADALPEGAFAVVMATGIVSLATDDELPLLSDALLAIAVAALVVLSALVVARPRVQGRRAGWWDAVTFVAGTGAVAAGFAARGDGDVAHALELLAIAAWAVTMLRPVPWTRPDRRRQGDEASGRRLLLIVATQSAVISAASIDRWAASPLLAWAATAAWAVAIVLHVRLAGPIARGLLLRRQRGRFRADDWILMGVLAISALAASALLRAPDVPVREGVRLLGLAVWVGACLWIPLLARIDLASTIGRRPAFPRALRWSMVFPFGMFAASSQALGRAAGDPVIHVAGLDVTWVALAAWAAIALGIGGRVVAGRVGPAASRLDGHQLPE